MISASSFLLAAAIATAQVAVPALKSRVTDLTGTLTPGQQAEIEGRLEAFERRRGTQVAVLMLPTTQPEAIEQYSMRVVERWKLGRKKVDDGVLLIVAKNDRRLRIEVGYGLEGVLPDITAKRIISDTIVPRFKQGDFYGGLVAGTDRILRVIEGERQPALKPVTPAPGMAAEPRPRPPESDRDPFLKWFVAFFVAAVAAPVLMFFLLPATMRDPASLCIVGLVFFFFSSCVANEVAQLVYGERTTAHLATTFNVSFWETAGIATAMVLLALMEAFSRVTSRIGGGGFFSSSSGGGGSSFSGGGGLFGGGGASGDWGD